MVNCLGFTERLNVGSVYVLDFDAAAATTASSTEGEAPETKSLPTGKITVSTYVDDPIIACDNIEVEQWFY